MYLVHPQMARTFRTVFFTVLLGFHNSWEQEDASLEELARGIHRTWQVPMDHALERPERCFFWEASSLLN